MPTLARSTPLTTALILCPSLLVLAACSSPLGERPSDLGRHVGYDRLREVQPLSIERFKSEQPVPTPDAKTPLQRPPSRFEGLEQVTLTLAQCRAEALANNLDLKVALVDPLIADESLNVERAKFEAVFQPFARFRNDDRPTLQTTSANQQELLNLGAGVDIPLRTGGRISVDYTQNRVESGQGIFTASQLFSSDGTVSISQPLLRNAGREVNVASIQIAGYTQQIAETRTKLQVISQIAAADRAYWRLYAFRQALDVVQQQYEVAAELLAQADRRFNAGDVAEIEVIRAQSGVAERLESIIIAENNILSAQRELKRVINAHGLDVETRQVIVTGTTPDPVRFELNEAAMLSLAHDARMELLEIELQLLADAVSEGFQKNQLLPLLNLDASYTWSGLGTTFHDNNEEIRSGRFQSYFLGVSAEVPLGNEAAEARLRRATLTVCSASVRARPRAGHPSGSPRCRRSPPRRLAAHPGGTSGRHPRRPHRRRRAPPARPGRPHQHRRPRRRRAPRRRPALRNPRSRRLPDRPDRPRGRHRHHAGRRPRELVPQVEAEPSEAAPAATMHP